MSVLTNACTRLREILEHTAKEGHSRLPGIRQLAQLVPCSHYTMWKAVKFLEKEGALCVEHGRNIQLPGPKTDPAPPLGSEVRPALRKWEQTADRMENEIFSGLLRTRPALPSFKELAGRYGVSYQTLKRSLGRLVSSGLLSPDLQLNIHQQEAGRRSTFTTVYYFAWGDTGGNIYFKAPFDHEYLCTLESACDTLNVRLEKIIYTYENGRLIFIRNGQRSARVPSCCKEAAGFVIRTICFRDAVPELVPQLAALGPPITVIDEMNSPELPVFFKRYKNLQIVRHTISGTPARQAALHLAQSGHRHLGFFSPWRETIWSINREETAALTVAGLHKNIQFSRFTLPLPYKISLKGPENEFFTRLKADLKASRKNLGAAAVPFHQAYNRFFPLLKKEIWFESVYTAMAPLFEKALRETDLTAWIAVDDDTALLALRFLRQKNILVPDRLSLTGCDDIPDAARNDLTSFNFDLSRSNYNLLMNFLFPSKTSSRRHVIQETEGRLVIRGTTTGP